MLAIFSVASLLLFRFEIGMTNIRGFRTVAGLLLKVPAFFI